MVTKSDFVLEWDKALGFKGDPFADKIFEPINKFFVDRKDEKEKLNWFFIKNYFFGAIVGEQGVGKTSLLKWLQTRLMKYNRIHAVYINAAVFKEQVNITHTMIMPLLSFYEKSISKPHKKLVSSDFMKFLKKKLGHMSVALILDNAHHLTEKNLELIKSLKKDGLKLQVVVTSTPKEYEKSRLREIGNDEINITLRRLTFDEAKEMLSRRINAFGGRGIHPFTVEELKKIYDKADKNPREFLKLCRDAAIKLLIHKREMLEKKANGPEPANHAHHKPEAKPLKSSHEEHKVHKHEHHKHEHHGEIMDVKVRKATPKEAKEEKKDEDKKLFKIKFSLGKDNDKPKKKKHAHPAHSKDQRAIHDDEHKQDLLDKMSSTSPRRNDNDGGRDDSSISETDKLLKDLAEEFEVD